MFRQEKKEAELELFTISDSKGHYRAPTMSLNKDSMMREIMNMMRNPNQSQNTLLLNAEDYALYKIAEFEFGTGEIKIVNREHVANLIDLRSIVRKEQLAEDLRLSREQNERLDSTFKPQPGH